ncbi:MAG: M20 family metallopeptidase [Thermoanaerobacterales bacterium]|nr:M20 family metallopeptidase [Thermoanaerobacterales bacterium]
MDIDKLKQWFKCNDRVVSILRELIRFNTSNPPGNEHAIAVYIADWLEERGFKTEVQDIEKGRSNVIACIGSGDRIGMILCGHMDVVPAVGTWNYPPFDGTVVGGRLYGRGSCDMKGGIAAMMAAAEFIAKNGLLSNKGLALVFVCDEESKNKGMRGFIKKRLSADAAIIGEPTGLDINTGHRGFVLVSIKAQGVSCHSSQPENGVNAIYIMADVIKEIRGYAKSLSNKVDKYLGKASLSVGTIRGGNKVNIVPDKCEILMERRLLPGETAEDVIRELREWIGEDHRVTIKSYPELKAAVSEPESRLVKDMADVVKGVLGKKPVIKSFPAGCEASFFINYLKIPTIIFGPGSLNQAHKADEWVAINDLIEAAKIYSLISYRYLRR